MEILDGICVAYNNARLYDARFIRTPKRFLFAHRSIEFLFSISLNYLYIYIHILLSICSFSFLCKNLSSVSRGRKADRFV